MILDAFFRALGQIGDPPFRRVLIKGVGLTIGLLVAVYAGFMWLVRWLVPDSLTLPLIGEVTWIETIASGASVLVLLVLSVFLMVPVASAFTSLFLDDVADAVEAKHYPHLAAAPRLGLMDSIRDGLGFMGVLIAANIIALVAYVIMPPAAPLIFVALNGFLLGREYFQLVAVRRLGRAGAMAARRRYAARIWLAGALMAAPLAIPLVNLLVPVIGAATFTHLFHRLEKTGRV